MNAFVFVLALVIKKTSLQSQYILFNKNFAIKLKQNNSNTSFVKFSKAFIVALVSNGLSCVLPNIFGK